MGIIEYCPPSKVEHPENEPSIFLAGPIQGAPDWQGQAVRELARQSKKTPVHLYNPRRPSGHSPTAKEKFDYAHQVNWEQEQLDKARMFGTVLFWFARQDPDIQYPSGRAYAQTSRIELGRTLGWKDYDELVQIVVGFEPGYTGGNERYVRHTANKTNIPVYDNLPDLCTGALKLALSKRYGEKR